MRYGYEIAVLVIGVALLFIFFVPVIGVWLPECYTLSLVSSHGSGSISYYLFGDGAVIYHGQYQFFTQYSPHCHFWLQ